MKQNNLSTQEKAKILLSQHNELISKVYAKLSRERRRELDEDRRRHPEEEPTLEKYEQRIRKAHSFFDELKIGRNAKSINGVDVYYLEIDSFIGDSKATIQHDAFRYSRIANLSSRPDLLWFLNEPLRDFYFQPIIFGKTANERLEYTLQTGKGDNARQNGGLFVCQHPAKALEYGPMPKVILGYNRKGLRYISGPEGYESEFIGNPKYSLLCVLKIGL
jgi:hypothetical protein